MFKVWNVKFRENPFRTFNSFINQQIFRKILQFDPYGLYLHVVTVAHFFVANENPHISSIEDTLGNIHTKFGSNWSGGVKEGD